MINFDGNRNADAGRLNDSAFSRFLYMVEP